MGERDRVDDTVHTPRAEVDPSTLKSAGSVCSVSLGDRRFIGIVQQWDRGRTVHLASPRLCIRLETTKNQASLCWTVFIRVRQRRQTSSFLSVSSN